MVIQTTEYEQLYVLHITLILKMERFLDLEHKMTPFWKRLSHPINCGKLTDNNNKYNKQKRCATLHLSDLQ